MLAKTTCKQHGVRQARCHTLARSSGRHLLSGCWPSAANPAQNSVDKAHTAASTCPTHSWSCKLGSQAAHTAAALLLLCPWSLAAQAEAFDSSSASSSSSSSIPAQASVIACKAPVRPGWPSSTAPQPKAAPAAAVRSPLADVAGLFGGGSSDPIDPFTLYGTNFKKYVIEKLQGEKVVSRARGFTVDTCVSGVPAAAETPEFQGLPTGDKVQAGDNLLCKRAVGPDLKPACVESCGQACNQALSAYEAQMQQDSGYVLEPAERERVLKNCRRSCTYECTKSGKAHDFVVPYRR